MRRALWAALLFAGCSKSGASSLEAPPLHRATTAPLEERLCVRAVDGDTILLDDGRRVRYIGIDTPETKHPRKPVEPMGREASEANRRLVEGRKVGLEYDVERKDRYGRTLAYVWVGETMANERLLEQGFAQVSTYPPNVRHVERLLRAQRAAREAGRGLWGGGAAREEVVYATATGKKFHRGGCRHLGRSGVPVSREEAIARGLSPCAACGP